MAFGKRVGPAWPAGLSTVFFLGISLLLFLFVAVRAQAREFDVVPDSAYRNHYTRTDDGADLRIYELVRSGGQPILLVPGFGASGVSLEHPAIELWQAGYNVFVGNWRGSAALPEGMSPLAPGRNGLTEVIRRDFPALFSEVARITQAEERGIRIDVLGHSMGGMMISGALSTPRLRQSILARLGHGVLYGSPLSVRNVRSIFRPAAAAILPLLRLLKFAGIDTIDIHTRSLDALLSSRRAGGFFQRQLARAIQNVGVFAMSLVLSPAYTDMRHRFRVMVRGGARRIPVDLIEDFARALVEHDGEFLDAQGERLIAPEQLREVPFLVVRGSMDSLAPWEEQAEYFERLATPHKQLLDLRDMNHTDPVLNRAPGASFIHHVVEFLQNPRESIHQNGARIQFVPQCQYLLTRIRLRFRVTQGL